MCRRIAKGRRFGRCGHFLRLQVTAMVDCKSRDCELSMWHPKHCQSRSCKRNYGADIEEDIVKVDDFCWPCTYAASQTGQAQAAP